MQEQNWGDEELWIVTASSPSVQEVQTGQKSPPRDFNPYSTSKATVSGEELKESRIKAETLAAQMSQFVKVVSKVFTTVEKQVEPKAGLHLDEITLTVEISGEGEIKLLGTGGKLGGKGAIELKFKRIEPSK
ncbi:Pepco domain-containing protein [Pseudanabaena minima]|uniref:Pepco domain-containing protein n=1 Tax=Pseudanabaena minima TaxID=890415 RepID=UPI003DAA4D80